MKKFGVLLIATLILFGSCAIKANVTEGIGIPPTVTYIAFWNGGGLIHEASNAAVKMRIDTNTKLIGANISFYVYEVTSGGKTTYVVDSESLAIVYR